MHLTFFASSIFLIRVPVTAMAAMAVLRRVPSPTVARDRLTETSEVLRRLTHDVHDGTKRPSGATGRTTWHFWGTETTKVFLNFATMASYSCAFRAGKVEDLVEER